MRAGDDILVRRRDGLARTHDIFVLRPDGLARTHDIFVLRREWVKLLWFIYVYGFLLT